MVKKVELADSGIAVVGIDPGDTGAIAVIYPLVELRDVWDFDDPEGMLVLEDLAAYNRTKVEVFLERVHAMPKQGVSSTAKFMTNFGRWWGRLEALGLPFAFVTPQVWQKEVFGAMPRRKLASGKVDTKGMSLEAARRLYPGLAPKLTRKKDNGRADALCIAHFGRRSLCAWEEKNLRH